MPVPARASTGWGRALPVPVSWQPSMLVVTVLTSLDRLVRSNTQYRPGEPRHAGHSRMTTLGIVFVLWTERAFLGCELCSWFACDEPLH
jgi:hypothetical protein